MRGTPGVIVVAPGVGARPDRHETVAALGVGQHTPVAREVGVKRRSVRVVLMPVAAGRVALPDLDQGVRDGPAVLIQHAPTHDDALAERLTAMLAGEVAVARSHVAIAE